MIRDRELLAPLLRMRFARGGRGDDGTIDCLGVVLWWSKRLDLGLLDPWQQVGRDWLRGCQIDAITCFPAGWQPVELEAGRRAPRTGDVWIWNSPRQAVGIAIDGHVHTAIEPVGVVILPSLSHPVPQQIWRRTA